MKREIKFRGKRTDGKGWVYGYYYEYSGKHIICWQNHSDNATTDHFKEVIGETVGQFNGLKDIFGIDIFDGDIVRWGMHGGSGGNENWHRYAVVQIEPDIQFKIIYYIDSESNEKKPTDNHILNFGNFAYSDTGRYLEIIGNVYDNPEMLQP